MKKKRTRTKKRGKSSGRYSFEFRLQVVRMYLEEQYPVPLICSGTGVGRSTISAWVKKYRTLGEDGLRPKTSTLKRKSRINTAVKRKIVDVKKTHPEYGSRRISDILKRFFIIKTSPSTVHKTCLKKISQRRNAPSRRETHQNPDSSNVQPLTSCGNRISVPSGWPVRTPI